VTSIIVVIVIIVSIIVKCVLDLVLTSYIIVDVIIAFAEILLLMGCKRKISMRSQEQHEIN